ncbi:rhodopsin-like GPCR transmembrane domain-containing protein [Pelagophyceae sp. CCMP2097]|nr:rhodopsin-like GPCR transmembrane domain-containing protein [Pelagophyceae sp. CCMP2097]
MRLAGVGLAAACMVWPCGALETKKRRYRSDSPWWYAQRFVFSGDRGVLRYETETRGLYMLLYLEEDFRTFNGINAASYASSTMEARFNKAHSVIWLGEGPDLRNATAAQTFAALGGGNATDETVKVKGSFEYTGSSMRWFYVVFANFDPLCNRACRGAQGCNLEYAQRCYGGVDVHVKLKLHNDGLRYREFSYDEASIFEAVTMIFALYVILCVAGAVVAALLLFRNKCHPVCSLLLAAIGLSALSQLLFMIHYATYTVDGRGLPKALAAAFYVAACADTLMCAVCILCAQGYNIVRRKLRGRTRMHVAIFSTTYVVANICVVAWHSLGGGAKGTSIFLYDSPSGYLFLFLRCLTAIWILRAAIQMQAHFRAKAGFYYRFCIVAATWVCAAPFVALVASLSPESERLKVSMV